MSLTFLACAKAWVWPSAWWWGLSFVASSTYKYCSKKKIIKKKSPTLQLNSNSYLWKTAVNPQCKHNHQFLGILHLKWLGKLLLYFNNILRRIPWLIFISAPFFHLALDFLSCLGSYEVRCVKDGSVFGLQFIACSSVNQLEKKQVQELFLLCYYLEAAQSQLCNYNISSIPVKKTQGGFNYYSYKTVQK